MSTGVEQGPLTEAVFYILLALYQPMHGYGIMQFTSEISAGRVALGPGTLYGALNTLVEKGLIKIVSTDNRKKEYQITPAGQVALQVELTRLEELLVNGKQIVEEYVNEAQSI